MPFARTMRDMDTTTHLTVFGISSAWLAAFVTTSTLLNITPGPAVMQVVGHSMVNGARSGQASIAGILSANAMYMALAALGLGALILAVPQLFEAIKWCGMAYLAWLGLKSLKGAWAGHGAGATATLPPPAPAWSLYRQSFLLQGANPKSVVFFCALLPTFAGSADGAPMRIVMLGLLAIVIEYPVLLAYSLAASKARLWLQGPAGRRMLDALAGVALLGAAGSVASTSLRVA
jgi:homoserine/homoserine lactone efflux protein